MISQSRQARRGMGSRGLAAAIAMVVMLSLLVMTSCGKNDDSSQETKAKASVTQTENKEKEQTDPGKDADPKELLTTLFFTSDYQAVEGLHSPKDNLSAVLDAVKEDGGVPEQILVCGDYTNDRDLHDYELSPDGSISEIRETVKGVFPDIDEEDMLFVQGNHDKMTDEITSSGLHEYEDHLVYVLNTEQDFPWKQGKTSGCLDKVKRSSKEMKECFDALISRGETRPVFIAGHVPIHFTARTSSRHTTGDNLYSSLIYDVVDEAAGSLDIVYFFGHNHSKGWDCYLGGSSVYKAKGDKILIPEFKESDARSDSFREETLRFTYLNAGYIGYYMNCGPEEYDAGRAAEFEAADGTLTGTLCRIYPNRIELTRYSSEGVHQIGSDGAADPYKGGIDAGLIPEEYYSKQTDSPQEVTRR